MRRLRWLVPPVILFILVAVWGVYVKNRDVLARSAPTAPKPLAKGVTSNSNEVCTTQSDGDKPRFEVCSSSSTQLTDPPVMELTGVRMKLYRANATEYDSVTSDKAQFDQTGKKLFSDGDVTITLGVPADSVPNGKLLSIHGSGVEFSSETGEATTTRAVRFEFEQGSGSAVGAHYSPTTRELRLDSGVVLDWRGKSADTTPMHIEAGQAWYFEKDSKVILHPWAKLTRESLHMESRASELTLDNGRITRASVAEAKGVQETPAKKVEFGAAQLYLDFDDDMRIKNILGEKNATLTSTAKGTRTAVTGDRMDMAFEPSGKDALLTGAVATGKSVVQADPVVRTGPTAADTRILRSDVVRMFMRPGGEEIDRVETDGPGTMDFVPNRADQPKRNLQGDRIWIYYGPENRIRQFNSNNASTTTERPVKPGTAPLPPMHTASKELIARFDPASSELTSLEQNTAFHYEEGDRTAKADHATLDQSSSVIVLNGSPQTGLATSNDPTGTIAADRITLNQKSGDTIAEGRVATTRQPNRKPGTSGMLSKPEPLQATAQKMTSTNKSQHIRYEGNAIAWQGADRVEANRIEIDQEKHITEAHGKVKTQFVDSNDKNDKNSDKAKAKSTPAPAPFTVVQSSDLVYTDTTHIALYQGGVHLDRPGLTTDSRELRAFLKDTDSGSSLDKAYAEGDAKIVSTAVNPATKEKRTRTGTSDRSEYYVDEQKVILVGGKPLLVDSLKGQTTGNQLTWWANNDRLLVDGEESKPTRSIIRKTK